MIESIDRTANLGLGLMVGDPSQFKQGYTFANALIAACEHDKVTELVRIARVAERMHLKLGA